MADNNNDRPHTPNGGGDGERERELPPLQSPEAFEFPTLYIPIPILFPPRPRGGQPAAGEGEQSAGQQQTQREGNEPARDGPPQLRPEVLLASLLAGLRRGHQRHLPSPSTPASPSPASASDDDASPPPGFMHLPPLTFTIHLPFPLGFPPPREEERKPDPRRAETILAALSRVGKRGVRRMERVGMECACGVCFEGLLEGEGMPELEAEKKEEEPTEAQKDAPAPAPEPHRHTHTPDLVPLPCSHVFHASCLRPWLARVPSCPTCRYDLDPHSVTLSPPSDPSTPNPAPASNSSSNRRAHPYSRPSAPPPKPYTPPTGPRSLADVLRRRERELGLRCDAACCAFAPSSDLSPDSSNEDEEEEEPERTMLNLVCEDGAPACPHLLHPTCLRTASRVEGYLREMDQRGGERGGEEVGGEEQEKVLLRCPVCKTPGSVSVAGLMCSIGEELAAPATAAAAQHEAA